MVGHIRTAVLNTTSVRVSWSALALPPGVHVTHYFVRYSSSTVPPQEGTRQFPASVSCGEVGGLVPHTAYLFHVEGMILDIDGSVSQEGSPDTGSVIFVPGITQILRIKNRMVETRVVCNSVHVTISQCSLQVFDADL